MSKGSAHLTPREKLYKQARACARKEGATYAQAIGVAFEALPVPPKNWEIDTIYGGNVRPTSFSAHQVLHVPRELRTVADSLCSTAAREANPLDHALH